MILKMRLASLRMTTPLRVIMRGIMISSRQNGRKKMEPTDHLDHDSYSWCLRNYTICKLVVHNLQTGLNLQAWLYFILPLLPLKLK